MLYLTRLVCVIVLIRGMDSTPVLDAIQAVGRKEGHCPMILPESVGQCSNTCIYDSDCEDNRKCCLNGCGGTTCISPQSDPCIGYQCPRQGQTCISLLTHAVCLCNTHCPDVSEPVCGSDGNTFSNKCYMDAHACELSMTIGVVPCSQETIPIDPPIAWSTFSPHEETMPGENREEDEDDSEEEDSSWLEEQSDGDSEDYDDIIPPGSPELVTIPGEVIAYVGDPANIECDVKGNPVPSKFWQKDDRTMFPGQTYGEIFVSEKGVLHFPSAHKEDAGNYVCMAVNSAGSLAAVYALNVIDRPDDNVNNEEDVLPADDDIPALDDVCYEPQMKGTCHQYEAAWFYNQNTKMCEVFVYGGCNGNNNRFPSYEQCREVCPMMPENKCQHPMETGPCRGYFPRWGWDSDTKDCVPFIFGGCLGNENNFDDKDKCMGTCFGNEVDVPDETDTGYTLDVVANEEAQKTPIDIIQIDKPATEIEKPAIEVVELKVGEDGKAILPDNLGPRECDDCEPETSLHESFCGRDFALSGTITEIQRIDEKNLKLTVSIDGRYKNVGLDMPVSDQLIQLYFKSEAGRDCLCPLVRADGTSYILMGHVVKGVDARKYGVLDETAYMRPLTDHRRDKLMRLRLNPVFECNELYSPYL